MRKDYGLRIDTKKLLTLSLAATMLVSVLSFVAPSPKAYAAFSNSYSAGSGTGTIFLTLHRLPESYWPWCFAKDCQQLVDGQVVNVTTGTGTWMNFIVYNSAGKEIIGGDGQAFANEDGVFITGLTVGQTYLVSPLYFNTTGIPGEMVPHKVIFNNWADCSSPYAMADPRPFTITSNTIINAAGYYRYVPDGMDPNAPQPCYEGAPVKVPTGATTPHVAAHHKHKWSVDMDTVYSTLNMKQTIVNSVLNGPTGAFTTVASTNPSNVTALTAKNIPSTSLSGIPIGPSGTVVYYNSLYDLQNSDSDGIMNAMKTAQVLGIDWNNLSDMQKAYLTLSLQYNTPTGSMIPDKNLSGLPLGPSGVKVTYKSLYDVQNADSDGVIKAMLAADALGIDWNSLSDMQKSYMALTLDYGLPSSQV